MIARLALVVLAFAATQALAEDYYVHPELGDDRNPGTSAGSPWRSLDKVNATRLGPGDRVLLAAGQRFTAELELKKLEGSADAPIVITSYTAGEQEGRAIIDARGLPSAIHIVNSSHITIRNIELTANGGEVTWRARDRGLRAAVLIELTRRGDYEDLRFDDLDIHDVFFEDPEFVRGAEEARTANGTQSYGFGIRLLNSANKATLTGLTITNSKVARVSHTGIKLSGGHKHGIRDIRIEGNRVTDTGGPGMQMSLVRDMLVRDNVVNGSGSTLDSRNWGRGSGMWTWKSEDVLIEKNAFMNANGPADSAGVHIDFGCRNVIVQYNLSANNAGGFYEVLGDNHNTAYRYNVSINDGHRVKGENGAFQEGKTFWLSGYVGRNAERTGPFDSYFYNNTIFVDPSILARVALANTAEGVLIANNIFHILGESAVVPGDQHTLDRASHDGARVVFRNNLFLDENNWPAGTGVRDSAPIIGDPGLVLTDAMKIGDFRPTNTALVANRGIDIEPIPGDPVGLPGGLAVSHDILGNPIDGLPDLGAIEVSAQAVEKRAPNIVVILADDAGYADFGFQGSDDVLTPNIDDIASNGISYTNAYVTTPFCSPSRAGILTGRYPQRYGYEFNLTHAPPPGVDAEYMGLAVEEKTLGDYLRAAGYATIAVGKWHVGHAPQFHPNARGFDHFYGFLGGGSSYHPDRQKPGTMLRDGDAAEATEYLTDDLAREAAAYIEQYKDRPFFLYLAFNAVHTPMDVLQADMQRFAHVEDEHRRRLAAMTWAMDRAVGNVVAALEEYGLLDDTLLIFTNDNGGDRIGIAADNAPLRGTKGTLLEGGIRVPFAMQWPGVIEPGSSDDSMVSLMDIVPSAITVGGGEVPDQLDGRSLLSPARGPAGGHESLFWRYDVMAAVRSGNWKLLRFPDRPPQLYDLSADIGESDDLAAARPETVGALMKQLFAWEAGLIHARWNTGTFWSQEDVRRYDSAYVDRERAKTAQDISGEVR